MALAQQSRLAEAGHPTTRKAGSPCPGLGAQSNCYSCTVGSGKLEYGSGLFCAGFPSSQGFGVGGQLYCNFLASVVRARTYVPFTHFRPQNASSVLEAPG